LYERFFNAYLPVHRSNFRTRSLKLAAKVADCTQIPSSTQKKKTWLHKAVQHKPVNNFINYLQLIWMDCADNNLITFGGLRPAMLS
jgi:hypothetical protein